MKTMSEKTLKRFIELWKQQSWVIILSVHHLRSNSFHTYIIIWFIVIMQILIIAALMLTLMNTQI